MPNKKANLCVVVLFLFANFLRLLALPSTVSAKDPDSKSLEKIRLQLKWRHQFQFAGYYAAIEKGYFHNEGLSVELIEGKPDLSIVDQLVSGRVDFAIDTPSILLAHQKGVPLVVLAAIFQHSPEIIITRKDSGLTTPQSLKGKKLMLPRKAGAESMAMLIGEGISLQSLNVLPHSWGLADLIANRIDAQTAYLTNEPYLLKKNGVDVNIINPVNYGVDFYGDCIITTKEQVRSNIKRIESFRRAVCYGWLYAMNHPEEIAELIMKKYSKEKTMDQLLFEAEAMRNLIQPELVEIGHINPNRWRHIADTFVTLGMLNANYSLQGFLYADLRDQITGEKQARLRLITAVLISIGSLSVVIGLGLTMFNRRLAAQVRTRTSSLAESEKRFRAFFEMASVGVTEVDVRSGQIRLVNNKFCEIVGYSFDELTGLSFTDITHPEDLKSNLKHIERLVAGEILEFTIEKRYIRKDGEIIWVVLSASPLWSANQEPDYMLVAITDITAMKNAEEMFAKAFHSSPVPMVISDIATGRFIDANEQWFLMLEYSRTESIGHTSYELNIWEDPKVRTAMTGQLLKEGSFRDKQIRLVTKSGRLKDTLWSAEKVTYGNSSVMLSLFYDFTDWKEAEDALRESESYNKVLFHGSQISLAVIDPESASFIDCNQAAVEIYGFTYRDQLIGKTPKDISAPCQYDGQSSELAARNKINEVLDLGSIVFEWRHQRPSGEIWDSKVHLMSFVHQEKILIQLNIQDITGLKQAAEEKEKLQAQLQQSQKMEAIGTLAGGIAHDFNNILSAMYGYTQLAQMSGGKPDKLEKSIDGICQATDRAKNLVKQILAFSRQGKQEKRPISLTQPAREVMTLVRQTVPTTIEIIQEISSTLTILADPTQMHQLLMNLCTNAYHAMRQGGGTLQISILDKELKAPEVQREVTIPPGRYVTITVSDSGTGINTETMKNMFEPYFTTKDVGEGTGLGLAVVHGIVTDQQGYIFAESEPGKGTTFRVYLPASESGNGEIPEESTAKYGLHGNERVLFVDDEEDIRRIADKVFSIYGYRIQVFADPKEALAHFMAAPDLFDLLITDMTMPKMTGIELIQCIHEIRPGLPVFLCTGYSELISPEEAKAQGITDFINKPLRMTNLLGIIRKNLRQQEI
ncbi:MAG: ABC transporter substrate-binding protein [Desulforhopalus sp.]